MTEKSGSGSVGVDHESSRASTTDPHPDSLQAGRELDALIAEKVMGFRFAKNIDGNELRGYLDGEGPVPTFSTDIRAAWSVVEKLKTDGYEISVHNSWPYNDGRRWACDIVRPGSSPWNSAQSDTAPLAICRAALKCVAALSSSPTNLREHVENG